MDYYHKDFEHLKYNSKSGKFTWLKTLGSKRMQGEEAGCKTEKGILIGYDKSLYRSHRLAWLFVYGKWPDNQIDHIDGNPLNNKLDNLRDVESRENQLNCKLGSNNTSGHKGVNYDKERENWYSCIYDNGKYVYLGAFKNYDEAVAKRKAAEKKYRYHENHGRIIT